MRSIYCYSRVLMLSLLPLIGAACATKGVRQTPALSPTQIINEVGTEFQSSVAAWNAGDLSRFMAIYAETATIALAERHLLGRQAIWDFYAPSFNRGARRDELAFEQFDVEILSPDTVLVRGIYRNSRNGEITRHGATTLVLRRILNQWRIIHDHSN